MSALRKCSGKKTKDKTRVKKQKNNNSDLILKTGDFQVKIQSSNVEKDKIMPPNLLLSYLYHLNVEHSKYVTSGFNSKTFSPSLIINNVYEGFIELNEMEYSSIFLKSKEINKYFNHYEIDETIDHIVYDPANLIQYTEIKYTIIEGVKHITLQVTGSEHRVTLNDSEWSKFNALFGFFNQLLFWYKSISPAVLNYYNHYLKLCADKNQIYLGQHEFFTPPDIKNNEDNPIYPKINFNYFRLFHEIGFLCTENITIKILRKIYSSK